MRRLPKRLTFDLCNLEERAVPANNLTIVDDLTPSVNIDVQQQATTVTFRTTDGAAELSVADIRTELLKPNVQTVVITTAVASGQTNANENGDLSWADEVLDLSGLGKDKTLRLETDTGATIGSITLDGVALGGTGGNTLALVVDSSGPDGNIDFLASNFFPVDINLPNAGSVTINAGTGNFTYQSGIFDGSIFTGGATSITAANVDLGSSSYNAEGTIAIGGTITFGDAFFFSTGNLTFTGPVTVAGTNFLSTDVAGTITFTSTLDGLADVTLDGKTTFGGNVGATTPLNNLTVYAGELTHGPNTIESTAINVGAGSLTNNSPAILGKGTGTITATSVVVNEFGAINPGGVGIIGVTNIVGDVAFNFGSFSPDLGPTSDTLNVTGTVDVSFGRLGGGVGVGTLPPAGSATVLTYTNGISGEFINAPTDAPAIAGADAVFVDDYAPAVVLKPVVAANLPGSDADGTSYTVKLSGGGELVTFQDPTTLFPSIVVRNATAKSALTVTTKANGSDELVMFNDIVVNGPLASFKGAKANVASSLRTTGKLGAVTLNSLFGSLVSGGAATDKLSVTLQFASGLIKTGSTISSLKVANYLAGQVQAAGILALDTRTFAGTINASGPLGKVKIRGTHTGTMSGASLGSYDAAEMQGSLYITGATTSIKTNNFSGFLSTGSLGSLKAKAVGGVINSAGAVGPITVDTDLTASIQADSLSTVKAGGIVGGLFGPQNWNIAGGIKSLTAGSIQSLNLTASFLETLTVSANKKLFTDGGVTFSSFILVGNNGGAGGSHGLKTATISGNVVDTVFDVQAGNVGAFTAGRFINSRLYVDYTPDVSFDIGGTFNGPPHFGITSFKTTAATIGNVNHPYNWSFAGSEVAARTIGTVDLSGINTANNGFTFGIKFQQGTPTIKVKTASNGTVPLSPASIGASGTAIADDFFVLQV